MSIQSVFADNMRRYRKAMGLTQEDLAEKSGLHRTYIGGIEQQRINVSMKNIEKIANALEVDPVLLLMKAHGSTALPTPEAEYYLAECTDEGLEFYPLDVKEPDIALQILASLAAEGYRDEELIHAFQVAQSELLAFFHKRHKIA